MAKRNTTSTVDQIMEILNAEIPGTSKVSLRRAARQLSNLMTTEIPGTPRTADLARQIMKILETEVPYTPKVGKPLRTQAMAAGRVEYVRLRGSIKDLSARASQLIQALDKHKGVGTASDMMGWLKVNRNVIAGALHELKQAGLIRSKRIA